MTISDSYAAYVTWARNNNTFPIGKTRFGNRMTDLGYRDTARDPVASGCVSGLA